MLRPWRCAAIWMLLVTAAPARADEPPAGATAVPVPAGESEPENALVPQIPPGETAPTPSPVGETILIEAAEPEPASAVVGTEIVTPDEPPAAAVTTGFTTRPPDRSQAYVIAESVFLQRDDQSLIQPLATQGGATVLSTGRARFATQPGLRLFVGAVNDCDRGWELGYLGVWNMFASRTATGPDDLLGPEPISFLVPEFNDRAAARVRPGATDEETPDVIDWEIEDLHLGDLFAAFEKISASIDLTRMGDHKVEYDDTPISLHQEDLVDRLTRSEAHQLSLTSVFEGRSHSERIGLFLAVLELVRQGRVRVRQDELNDPIELNLIKERDPNAPTF